MAWFTLRKSSTLTANGVDGPFTNADRNKGVRFFLRVTAVSGTTPTLDITLQAQDPVTSEWNNLQNVAYPQQTATNGAPVMLTVYPGIQSVANVAIPQTLPDVWRLNYTVGGTTPSFTFSIGAELIP